MGIVEGGGMKGHLFSILVLFGVCALASPLERYCVVDLASGPSAESYPVTYREESSSNWFNTTEYKTTR